ncbi:MAG: PTS sugar transporter subunit IIA [bacterium]|nr:PTS sugar transporter subunit IIA [bacterium]
MDLRLSDILDPACIRLGMEANDKTQALSALVDVLANSERVRDLTEVRRVILEREKLMSTGIGLGIALPHGKTNGVDSSVAALATLKSPIDFDSIDDKPVSIILMLVGTEGNVGMHLRLLSRISRMIGSDAFRTSLANATTAEAVMELFVAQEEERA